jgi:hypothetical protein
VQAVAKREREREKEKGITEYHARGIIADNTGESDR